jgi:hypothetical protein
MATTGLSVARASISPSTAKTISSPAGWIQSTFAPPNMSIAPLRQASSAGSPRSGAGRMLCLAAFNAVDQAVAKRTRLRLVRPMEEVEANLRIGLVDRLADASLWRLHRAAGVRAA